MPHFNSLPASNPRTGRRGDVGKARWLGRLPVFCPVFTASVSEGEGKSADEAKLPQGSKERAGSATC